MSELYFRLGGIKGFTSKDLADKKEGYTNPIRELLQNSLDASREAGPDTCEIKIHIETIRKTDIPHIDGYKKTLNKAIQTHKEKSSLNENARRVVASIQTALEAQNITVLTLVDNGTGMNQDKLDALLAGASTHQDELSGGSYGLGNLSSYALSSLRYVLYATKYKNGTNKTLFTGSPILAGHIDGDAQRDNRGRIVETAPTDEKDPQFIYPNQVPGFIQPKMEQIETGTIVSILGLSEPWGEEAEYAIASNFFHAILHDSLKLTIHNEEKKKVKSIDSTTVEELIAVQKDGKRAMGENILSGKAVYQAWDAIRGDGNQKKIELSNGDIVYVHIKIDRDALPTIVLIRNGMLIARHDSMLSGVINVLRQDPDLESFTAVIDVDQQHSNKLFALVKGAEGPYHNRLEKNRLTPQEEKQLQKLFKELSDKIRKHLQEKKRDSFDLPLFTVPNEAAAKSGGRNKSSGQHKKAQPITPNNRPRPNPNLDPDPIPPIDIDPRPAPVVISRNLESTTAVRYTDEGDKWTVHLRVYPKALDDRDEVYLSVHVGEDNDKQQSKISLDFSEIKMNEETIEITEVKNQVKLGRLERGKQYNVVAKFKKPDYADKIKVALQPILGLKRVQAK